MVRLLILLLILIGCQKTEIRDIDDLSDDMRFEYLKFLNSMGFEDDVDTGTMVVAWKACYDTKIKSFSAEHDIDFQTSIAKCIVTIVRPTGNQLN